MNAIGAAIAAKLFELIKPWLEQQWKQHGPELIAKVEAFIREQFTKWMPTLMKATVVAVAQAAGQLTINTVDKVTDIIPGQVDDQVVDPIVKAGMEQLARWGIRL